MRLQIGLDLVCFAYKTVNFLRLPIFSGSGPVNLGLPVKSLQTSNHKVRRKSIFKAKEEEEERPTRYAIQTTSKYL